MHIDNYSTDLFGVPASEFGRKPAVELEELVFPTFAKRRYARPAYFSRIPRGTDIATAAYGASLLGHTLLPQGEEIAALLCAKRPSGLPLYDEAVILVPRRASKTSAVWAELIGDCAAHPGRRVLVTAQDGSRIREILRDEIMEQLRGERFEQRGLGRLLLSNGAERIEFANRSLIRAVPPKPGAFRSKPADRIYIDEGGEFDAGATRSLLAALMPTTDTRAVSQVIVSGTPGGLDDTGQPTVGREGLLWDTLQAAKKLLTSKGRPPAAANVGVLAYMLRDDDELVTVHDDGTVTVNPAILRRVHPGIGTLTTLPKIASRIEKLSPVAFESEYGCRFPATAGDTAIDPKHWAAASGGEVLPERPARVGLGWDVEPDGTSAALLAAWRDADDIAHLEVLVCRPGYDWLPASVKRAVTKHRGRVGYDAIGTNLDVAQVLTRLGGAPATPIQLRHMVAATARLDRSLKTSRLRHYEQADLSAAAAGAVWRNVGENGRLLGRKASAAPVCVLVAAAVALWQYDQDARRGESAGLTTSTSAA